MLFATNLLLSASIISLCVWISKKAPDLAGFIVSLPLSTLIVLALNQLQNKDPGSSIAHLLRSLSAFGQV